VSDGVISYSKLTAALIIDGAIAMIAGKVQGKAPVESVALSPEQRQKAGLDPSGATLFYPAGGEGEDGVFFDMAADRATIWYNNGDFEQGVRVFELALQQAYPNTKYLGETANPNDPTMRSRGYEVELGEGRVAIIDAAFTPPGGGGKRQFAVRVFAKRRPQ
jgi:hypothetical protein